jgi:hypothetical protein
MYPPPESAEHGLRQPALCPRSRRPEEVSAFPRRPEISLNFSLRNQREVQRGEHKEEKRGELG